MPSSWAVRLLSVSEGATCWVVGLVVVVMGVSVGAEEQPTVPRVITPTIPPTSLRFIIINTPPVGPAAIVDGVSGTHWTLDDGLILVDEHRSCIKQEGVISLRP